MTWQKYFRHAELACRCCGEMKVTAPFLEKLTELREAWGKPMIVTSCCRCRKHNDSVGGAHRSFHLFDQQAATGVRGTIAIDIAITNMLGQERRALALLAMQKGWSIGVAKTFLHFDRRADYPETGFDEPILFTY